MRWPRTPRRPIRFPSTEPTSSSSTSATPSRPATTTGPPSVFSWWPTGVRRPGPATAPRYLLQQNKVRLLLTSPLSPEHPRGPHVALHGDGVRDIALWVDDARKAFEVAVERGARPAQKPTVLRDDAGEVVDRRRSTPTATPSTAWSSGGTTRACFLPGFQPVSSPLQSRRRSVSSTWTTASATSSSAR